MGLSERLLEELEAMGFPRVLVSEALSSGNTSLEAAINWLIDHAGAANDMSKKLQDLVDINIDASETFHISEQVQFRAQELRNQTHQNKADSEKKSATTREREMERIRAGKQMLEARRMAEESERKRFISQKKAEKEEERKARESIRQKLQQDKLERRGVHGSSWEGSAFTPETALPLAIKRQHVQTSDTDPLKPIVVREHMRQCLRSIKRRNKEDNAKVTRAFQILHTYVENIVNYPGQDKFRKIRTTNRIFQDRVGKFEDAVKFLELCGFERAEGGEYLVMPQDKVDLNLLRSADSELQNAITNPFFGLLSI